MNAQHLDHQAEVSGELFVSVFACLATSAADRAVDLGATRLAEPLPTSIGA